MKRVLIAAVLAVAGWPTLAQPARAPDPSSLDAPERLAWTALRGTAIDLSVGSDGAAFSIDPQGQVWMRRAGAQSNWALLPGRFARIDAASEREAWAVDGQGAVYRYNGTYWQSLPAPAAEDVAVGGGAVYLATRAGELARLQAHGSFATVPGAPTGITRVDVDDQGRPWVIASAGALSRLDGERWTRLPGSARDVSAGSRGGALMVDSERRPMRWNAALGSWTPLLALADAVAAGPDNKPWIVTPQGLIYANDPEAGRRAPPVAPVASVFIQALPWQRLPGQARSLAISARGQVMALGPAGEVWQWRGRALWQRLPGSFARLALDPAGVALALSADGQIFSWRGSSWTALPGRALDLSITPQGVAWILQPDGSPAFWNLAAGWVSIQAPSEATRLAVGPSNEPWIITRDGAVRSHDGRDWVDRPGIVAADLAIGPEGTVFAVGRDQRIARYDSQQQRWDAVAGVATAIAVGPRDRPWIVGTQSDISASSLFDEPTLAGGDCGAGVGSAVASFRAADFVRIPNVVGRDIAIGKDGNVMITDADSALQQWQNQSQSFRAFPGQFTRIAIAPDGNPWGITPRGEAWRHDGKSWLQVRGNFVGQDIAIGCNGTVLLADREEWLHKFNPRLAQFERLLPARAGDPPPRGRRVAVDPQGQPWTIRDDWIYRCDAEPCERQALRARDIAIGPDGTLVAADFDGNLQLFNGRDNRWDRVGVGADAVAVGPGGKPWVVRNGEVLRSALFNRREDKDPEKAAGTAASALNSSSPPPFTFTINMRFDAITPPVGFSALSSPNPEVHLAFAPTGKLMVMDSARAFWTYDEGRNTLVRDFSIPTPDTPALLNGAPTRSFVIGTDGTYWLTTTAPATPRILRRPPGGAWQFATIPADCGSTPGCGFASPIGVGIGPDGAVYAASEGNNLYRWDPLLQRFMPFTQIPRPPGGAGYVTLDPQGRFWIASPGQGKLFEYSSLTGWQARFDAVIGSPAQCYFTATPCVSIGGTGTAYGLGAVGQLVRWNAASGVWERITSSPLLANGSYLAGPDGRPWVWTGPGGSPAANTLYRGR